LKQCKNKKYFQQKNHIMANLEPYFMLI